MNAAGVDRAEESRGVTMSIWDVDLLGDVLTSLFSALQWGAADAEIKVPSVEITELKGSLFTAWRRSVYSHTCYACCQGNISG